jgi:hypothetical protein
MSPPSSANIRPPAELRPRRNITRRNTTTRRPQIITRYEPTSHILEGAMQYIMLYGNLRPVRQIVNESGILQNIYRILHQSAAVHPSNQPEQYIPQFLIHPITKHIRVLDIGNNTAIGLAVSYNERSFYIIDRELPPNTNINNIYIVIWVGPELTFAQFGSRSHTQSPVSSNMIRAISVETISTEIVDATTPEDAKPNYCCICMETKPADEFARIQCTHEFCTDCTQKHIDSSIKNKTTNLACPLCRTVVSHFYVKTDIVKDRIKQYISGGLNDMQ